MELTLWIELSESSSKAWNKLTEITGDFKISKVVEENSGEGKKI